MSLLRKHCINPKSITINNTPVEKMRIIILRERIKSVERRGLFFITSLLGGNDANANAAKVSIMRFTHNICVTVNGDCVPVNAPITTMRHATIFTTSWNNTNR